MKIIGAVLGAVILIAGGLLCVSYNIDFGAYESDHELSRDGDRES